MYVVFFLLGNSPGSEFYVPTFRNTLCSIYIVRVDYFLLFTPPVKLEQCSEIAAQNLDSGELPKIKNTPFTSRRKFEIQK